MNKIYIYFLTSLLTLIAICTFSAKGLKFPEVKMNYMESPVAWIEKEEEDLLIWL